MVSEDGGGDGIEEGGGREDGWICLLVKNGSPRLQASISSAVSERRLKGS